LLFFSATVGLPCAKVNIPFDENLGSPYYHYRDVEWFALDIPRDRFDQDILYSFGAFMTVCAIHRNNAEERIKDMAQNNWKVKNKSLMQGIQDQDDSEVEVDLEEYNMPPALITKNDGSTLYMTRDLAAAIYRHETYNFDKCVYVVGSQQNLHFEQWFKVIELMGFDWAKDLLHVGFGMVALENGTMSTRKGRVVFLEDVLKQAIEKTKETIIAKNPNALNADEIAKQVGVGAVVFQELSNSRIKDYTFSWDRTLSFDGETGPYVQYTHARCCAVLRKANEEVTTDINYDLLNDVDSAEVLKVIASFNKCILSGLRKNEPHIITRFVLDLAQAFNKFYHDNSILVEDVELRKARLALVAATRQSIENGLKLLGMHAPERM